MVTEVNNIIFNTLVAERAISLPGIGTLSAVRRAAEIASSDVVTPPSYVVEFSSHGSANSVIDAIANEAGIDIMQAEDIYSRWLDKVQNGTMLHIDGVGTLRDKSFVADASFLKMFNTHANPIKIKRKKRGRGLLIIIVLLLLLIIGLGIAGWLYEDKISVAFNGTDEQNTEIGQKVCEANDNTITEEEMVITPSEAIEKETAEDIQPVIEEEINANNDIQETDNENNSWISSSNIYHWVIIGSYSTEDNANIAIKSIEAKHDDIDCAVIKLGWMYAVAAYGSSSHDDCTKFMRTHRKEFEQMWIHTPKHLK